MGEGEEVGQAPPAAAEGPVGGPEGGGSEALPPGAGGANAAALVEPEVDSEALAGLEAMGFGRNRAVRALHGSGGGGVEAAVAWLEAHQDEVGLDEPLLVPPAKAALSAEEAREKADELVRRAKARREAEEQKLEKDREKMRVRMGKEIQDAQRIEKDQAFARRAEERRLEREEEERARAKIRAKLEEDRRERRRKLGLPEEETEAERAERLEREAARAKEEAERANDPNRPAVRAAALQVRLRACLVQVKKQHGDGATVCFKTLMKYAGNIAGNPAEEKFRRINKVNMAFVKRVGALGGEDFLRALGFEDQDDGFLVLPADKVDRAALEAAGTELSSALSNPFFGVL